MAIEVKLNTRTAKIIAAVIAVCFLAIHVAMVSIFATYGVTPMVYFNVFSLVFYAFSFLLIYKERLRVFSALVYLEVLCHMVLAVYFTGWGNGFQITLIGMSALAFFAEYIGHVLHIKPLHALPLCVLGMCMYLGVFIVSVYCPAPYPLPSEVSFWLQVAWGIIVFVISIGVLQAFIASTFGSEQTLTEKLEHDNLTGLPNRYRMGRYLTEVSNNGGLCGYWVAMSDIDDFKAINDTYGHNCGDFVLKELATVIRENAGEAEVCRWGGEEFLLVGHVEGSADELHARLERVRLAIAGRTMWYGEQKLSITITSGGAFYEEGDSISEWINKADEKLYKGKTAGKNRVVL